VFLALVYLALLVAVIWLLRRLARRPPETEVEGAAEATA
jgi:flagellar biogenesis protein FliO